MTSKKEQRPTVAQYLQQQFKLMGKPEAQIAQELGYDSPTAIQAVLQGKAKIPMAKLTQFAAAFGIDSAFLLRLVMKEYMPDTWQALADVFPTTILTKNELDLINAYREASKDTDSVAILCDRKVLAIVLH